MAKYITLEGLGHFLDKLKNSVCVKLKTNGGLTADSDGLSVKLKTDGGLAADNDGLRVRFKYKGGLAADSTGGLYVNPNNELAKLAIGPTLTTELNPAETKLGTEVVDYSFTMEPHQLTYIDLDETEEVCEKLSSITLLGFNEEEVLSNFDHTTQYFLQIKLGMKSCNFKTYSYSPNNNLPKIYWADGLVLGTLDAGSVYEVIFTKQLQDSTHLTAAWTKFK